MNPDLSPETVPLAQPVEAWEMPAGKEASDLPGYWWDVRAPLWRRMEAFWPAECYRLERVCVRDSHHGGVTAIEGHYIRSPWPSWLPVKTMFPLVHYWTILADNGTGMDAAYRKLLGTPREEIEAEGVLLALGG